MSIYEVVVVDRRIRFATGELSANVWGFYEPQWWGSHRIREPHLVRYQQNSKVVLQCDHFSVLPW